MIDIKMDDNGDFLVDSDGDFTLVYDDERISQEIRFRVLTTKGDWMLSPQVGMDLESFIGLRQTPEILESIKRTVERELNNVSGLVEYEIAVAPDGDQLIYILIEFESVEDPAKLITHIFDLDLKTGLVQPRE